MHPPPVSLGSLTKLTDLTNNFRGPNFPRGTAARERRLPQGVRPSLAERALQRVPPKPICRIVELSSWFPSRRNPKIARQSLDKLNWESHRARKSTRQFDNSTIHFGGVSQRSNHNPPQELQQRAQGEPSRGAARESGSPVEEPQGNRGAQ